MKQKNNLRKALLTCMLALSILPVLPGTLPPAKPVPDEPEPGDVTEGEEEPGAQPLNDKDTGNKVKN